MIEANDGEELRRCAMARGLKISLAVSLLLNVGLAVGFLSFRSYVGSQTSKLVVGMAEAEASMFRSMLSDLESGDAERIAAVKERLKMSIENANTVSSMSRQAVK